jgi:energy-coupling factor transporter ATP-binding protein EcfA2
MNALIRNLHIRNYRSLEKASFTDCGPLNVLIGKNNAGKSSVLATLPLVFEHLATGSIVTSWPHPRHVEEFTHRDVRRALQIGIELDFTDEIKDAFCAELREAAPSLKNSVDQLATENRVSFIFRFLYDGDVAFRYIESISVGAIDTSKEQLVALSQFLLRTSEHAARDLFRSYTAKERHLLRIATMQKLTRPDNYSIAGFMSEKRPNTARFVVDNVLDVHRADRGLRDDIIQLLEGSTSIESLKTNVSASVAAANDAIEQIQKSEIEPPIDTFTGSVRVQPAYISTLCKAYGDIPILKLGEQKKPIGRNEANRLLQLKVKRGGTERLQVVQNTVHSLLGVSLDAFQGDGEREYPEIDVDNFLAEANGAGIRESLRLILDIELEPCQIVLIEEPEVHLHPGLEIAVHSYLQEKSRNKQIFVTTHSTNFVDAVSPLSIFLITRDKDGASHCEKLGQDDAPVKLPAELGIRLSTVFMFDRIVFVEGPSDEAVLRELSRAAGST